MHSFLFELDMFLLLVFLMLGFSKTVSIREFHHGYLGDFLVVVSFLFGGIWLALVGFALRLDDTYQHFRQVVWSDSSFESPVKKLYGKYLYPIPCVRQLQEWLDKKFGKK